MPLPSSRSQRRRLPRYRSHTTSLAQGTSAVAVLLNQGIAAPGVLSSPKSYPGPASGLEVLQVNTGDFNGDGKQDIIAGAVFYGNGDGTLQTPVQTSATGSYVVGDFNNDGCTDIAYLVTSGTVGTSHSARCLL